MTSHTIPAPRGSTDLRTELQAVGAAHDQAEHELAQKIRELLRIASPYGDDDVAEQAVATFLGWDVEQIHALLRRVARRSHPAGKRARAMAH